ncbi:MAG: hypothetical protein ACRBK7_15395 [Acidimicrobiales bacterium]
MKPRPASDDFDLAVFVTGTWRGTPVNLAHDEHDEIAWLRPDDIADLTLAHPAIHDLATQALQLRLGPGRG